MKRIEIENDVIAQVYSETRSVKQTAMRLGMTASTVDKRLAKHGVERIGQRGVPRKLPPTIVADYNTGMSMNAIARKYSATLGSVAEALHRGGFTPRRKGGVWKGGKTVSGDGYVMVYAATHGLPSRYVMEHRLVMSQHIGRPLERHETVHHVNGVRDDNRIENLQLRSGQHGSGVAHRCRCCGSANIESARLN